MIPECTAAPEILETMSERFAPVRTALLLVDMQNDFCTPGFGAEQLGRDVSAAMAIVPTLQLLLHTARRAGVTIVHVGFVTLPEHASDSGPWLAQRRRSTASGEALCLADSAGQRFIDELSPRDGEIVVLKRRYSAFSGTTLHTMLAERGIQSLVITGVSTNACVESTARAGCDLDYYICVPPDAVGSWDRRLHEISLENINHRFGVTLGARDISDMWNQWTRLQEARQ